MIILSARPAAESHGGELAMVVSIAGVLVIVLLALSLLAWRRRGPGDSVLIAHLRLVNDCYTRLFHGVRPKAEDPFPEEGPAILVANHRSGVDPLVLAAYTVRPIRFLMAREYYEIRWLQPLLRTLGAIPVNRDGNDLAATKQALRALGNGEIVGIFPEGGIRNEDPDAPFRDQVAAEAIKNGAALLALRTGAPVVTAFIEGTPPRESILLSFLSFSRSRVSFGKPMHFQSIDGRKPGKEELQEATRRIAESIAELQENRLDSAAPRSLRP